MSDFLVRADPASGRVASVQLYGQELLDPADPAELIGVLDPSTGEIIGTG